MRYTHIVFDIDGTLLNSEQAVLMSLQKTLQSVGVEKTVDELKFVLGIPGKKALELLGLADVTKIDQLWNENFGLYYDEINLFSGIRSVIQELTYKGIELGILTSKTREEYDNDFGRLGLTDYFAIVICADDTLKHKPDSEPMEKYLQLAGVNSEKVLYIGDSVYDLQCAQNASVDFAFALWGVTHPNTSGATHQLATPREILSLLNHQDDEKRWLDWAMELQSIAQAGITYSKDVYDIERFERIRTLSAEIIAHKSEVSLETVHQLFCNETGFQTPKIDTRAAIFCENKILLVKETSTNDWSLPGGWVDVLESVGSNTIKEVKEETGYDVIPDRIIAIQDRNKHNTPRYAHGITKIFTLCTITGGSFQSNIETTEAKFFAYEELPTLSNARNTKEQIHMCFLAKNDPNWQVLFD